MSQCIVIVHDPSTTISRNKKWLDIHYICMSACNICVFMHINSRSDRFRESLYCFGAELIGLSMFVYTFAIAYRYGKVRRLPRGRYILRTFHLHFRGPPQLYGLTTLKQLLKTWKWTFTLYSSFYKNFHDYNIFTISLCLYFAIGSINA